jgi:hypothetical protein
MCIKRQMTQAHLKGEVWDWSDCSEILVSFGEGRGADCILFGQWCLSTSRLLKRRRTNGIGVLQVLIVVAKKPHNLLSIKWGAGKASGVTEFKSVTEFWSTRIGVAWDVDPCLHPKAQALGKPVWGQEERATPTPNGGRAPLALPFCSIWLSMDGMMLSTLAMAIFFTYGTKSNASLLLFQKHRYTQKLCFNSYLIIP